jgi:glycosyltransferase involved in cell wall biosynthesis
MDLCAEMLAGELASQGDLVSEVCRPVYLRRFTRLSARHAFQNADRLLNRMRNYPRYARELAERFDRFHIVDHSYAHLIHDLAADRCGVLCHDLDTFRCVLEPKVERRPRWFRAMTRRILYGLSKAPVIFYTTEFVRREIVQHGIANEKKLVKVPLGVAAEFRPAISMDRSSEKPYLLHVGSCVPRKRIDVLLNVFAEVHKRHPDMKLIQAGGRFTDSQREQLLELGVEMAVEQRRDLSRSELAALYQNAAAVLLTSNAEGFGLPAIEALACGCPLLCTDIPAFREVAADGAIYLPVGDIQAWAEMADRVLANPGVAPAMDRRLARATEYSWANHARIIAETYLRLGDGA